MYLQQPSERFEEKKHPIEMMAKCVSIFWILLVFLFSSPSACRFWSLGPFSEVDKAEAMMDSRVFLGVGAEMGPHWGHWATDQQKQSDPLNACDGKTIHKK